MPTTSKAPRYNLLRDFQATPGGNPVDPTHIDSSPAWLVAVVRLGTPLSYSRATTKSKGDVIEGAFTRHDEPLLITDDITSMMVSDSKRSHTKQLQIHLKHTGVNYIDVDTMLPGDWIMAWMFNNEEDRDSVMEAVRRGQQANKFGDGLKFVGRVQTTVRDSKTAKTGQKTVTYSISAIGFEELDNGFFYDTALATAANVSSDIRTFMAQIGLEFQKWAEQEQMQAGRIKDNSENVMTALIDMILGKGVSSLVNRPLERAGSELKLSPQANKEAPFAYLVPRTVGTLLGLRPSDASKGGIFGYADIMQTLFGVQQYDASADTIEALTPVLRDTSTISRKLCLEKLKGTFLPVNPSFVNVPLWALLQQYLNPAINEMYTCLRVDEAGAVRPTLVARQIPFSTESVAENFDLQLTRFLSLPRWVVPPVMEMDSGFRVARSNATRINMVHVYGDASLGASTRTVTNQLVRNPPIFDATDIQRSGLRAIMKTVNCAIADTLKAPRSWMEAIADWAFGSQYTLSGNADLIGIQSPICVGDNVEHEGMVYHIESMTHTCGIGGDGVKYFRTVMEVSNGMPVDQSTADDDAPRYPGFSSKRGLDDVAELGESADLGISFESKLKR